MLSFITLLTLQYAKIKIILSITSVLKINMSILLLLKLFLLYVSRVQNKVTMSIESVEQNYFEYRERMKSIL